jgi:lysyl-tRNA synthetase class 2
VIDRKGDALLVADAFVVRSVRGEGEASLGDLVVVDIVALEGDVLVASAIHRMSADARADRASPGETSRFRARGDLLRRRAALLSATRSFFTERGYLEVETPIVVPSPGLDIHLDALSLENGRYLITSPEYQMKRLLAGGLPRIFQIVKCFRKGEVGARHNPEFTMVEWYRAFAGFEEMIAETEELIVAVAGSSVMVNGRMISLTPPFERLPIATAFARHARLTEHEALRLADDDEERFFRVMVEDVEPALANGPPVVLIDWPASQASLARKKPGDPRVAERFEVMIAGVELCNGFHELVDPDEQRARFEHDQRERGARGLPVYPIDERFVRALEEGMPPSSGNALGLDRLIAMTLGAQTIGDVMTFPEEAL